MSIVDVLLRQMLPLTTQPRGPIEAASHAADAMAARNGGMYQQGTLAPSGGASPTGTPKAAPALRPPAEPIRLAGGGPVRGFAGGGPTLDPEAVAAINQLAYDRGLKPSDIATVMLYESARTMSPDKWGGTNNNYVGPIQLSADAREKYGWQPGMSQKAYIEGPQTGYFKARVKDNSGIEGIYHGINPGGGKYIKDMEQGYRKDAVSLLRNSTAGTLITNDYKKVDTLQPPPVKLSDNAYKSWDDLPDDWRTALSSKLGSNAQSLYTADLANRTSVPSPQEAMGSRFNDEMFTSAARGLANPSGMTPLASGPPGSILENYPAYMSPGRGTPEDDVDRLIKEAGGPWGGERPSYADQGLPMPSFGNPSAGGGIGSDYAATGSISNYPQMAPAPYTGTVHDPFTNNIAKSETDRMSGYGGSSWDTIPGATASPGGGPGMITTPEYFAPSGGLTTYRTYTTPATYRYDQPAMSPANQLALAAMDDNEMARRRGAASMATPAPAPTRTRVAVPAQTVRVPLPAVPRNPLNVRTVQRGNGVVAVPPPTAPSSGNLSPSGTPYGAVRSTPSGSYDYQTSSAEYGGQSGTWTTYDNSAGTNISVFSPSDSSQASTHIYDSGSSSGSSGGKGG